MLWKTQCSGVACSFYFHTFGVRPFIKGKIGFPLYSKIYFPNWASILVNFYNFKFLLSKC